MSSLAHLLIFSSAKSQYSAQGDIDKVVDDISGRVLKSATEHIDEEYGRLKKRVRKIDGQISQLKKSMDFAYKGLNVSTIELSDAITNMQRRINEDQKTKNSTTKGKQSSVQERLILINLILGLRLTDNISQPRIIIFATNL